jgi:hypothetical protein
LRRTWAHGVLKSPEDPVLEKLEWFRRGEASEPQWQDVLSILAAAHELDQTYLERWSRELGIADLLDRAHKEVADL